MYTYIYIFIYFNIYFMLYVLTMQFALIFHNLLVSCVRKMLTFIGKVQKYMYVSVSKAFPMYSSLSYINYTVNFCVHKS